MAPPVKKYHPWAASKQFCFKSNKSGPFCDESVLLWHLTGENRVTKKQDPLNF